MKSKTTDNAAGMPPVQRCITSLELFGNSNRVQILHAGVEYQLQITRQGKLILTK
jgi:hemin uptake protein HemP